MEIQNNVLKHYLRNCYFINGTAYAGKSTMCKMLAEKYDMILCEENYNMDMILSVATQKQQPNINYFNTKTSWQHTLAVLPTNTKNGTTEMREKLLILKLPS